MGLARVSHRRTATNPKGLHSGISESEGKKRHRFDRLRSCRIPALPTTASGRALQWIERQQLAGLQPDCPRNCSNWRYPTGVRRQIGESDPYRAFANVSYPAGKSFKRSRTNEKPGAGGRASHRSVGRRTYRCATNLSRAFSSWITADSCRFRSSTSVTFRSSDAILAV